MDEPRNARRKPEVSNANRLIAGNGAQRFAVERAHDGVVEKRRRFAGGLANDARVPDLREAELSGWINALERLQRLSVQSVVPGHGAATDSALLQKFGAYLIDLRQACDADIANRGDAASSGARLGLPQYRTWVEYAAQHPLNVAHAYREREDAQLMGEK